MTFAPCGTPVAFGLSTITWIARTRIPLLVAPAHGGAPPPSQVCSLRMTEPIPGTRMVVLGGGLLFTDRPPTERIYGWVFNRLPLLSPDELPPVIAQASYLDARGSSALNGAATAALHLLVLCGRLHITDEQQAFERGYQSHGPGCA